MSHIAILLFCIAIVSGLGVISRARRLSLPFNKPYINIVTLFSVSFNVFFLLNLLAIYLSVNLSERISPSVLSTIWLITGWLILFTTFGIAYFFYRMSIIILSMKKDKRIISLYMALYTLCIIGITTGQVSYSLNNNIFLFSIVSRVSKYLIFGISVIICMWVVTKSSNYTSNGRKKKIIIYGWLFSIDFLIIILLTALNSKGSLLLLSIASLATNILILFSINQFMNLFNDEAVNVSSDMNDPLHRHAEYFNISKREQEVLTLILKGNSNKEIENILAISSHTVKNHIYSIFQKTGVSSRGQLISKILGLK